MSEQDRSQTAEEWRAVIGYEGLYEVSNQGRVRSLQRRIRHSSGNATQPLSGRVLSAGANDKYGHLRVCLNREGCRKSFLVHRLVLEAFVGPCPDGKIGRHFPDRSPANNCLDNLQWGTHEENQADRTIHGTSNQGRVASAETRARLSASHKGYKRTRESIEKQRRTVTGSKRSPETRARMVAAWKLRKAQSA